MKIEFLPEDDGSVLTTLDGWKVKQYFFKKSGRWYVTISTNSPLARLLERNRLLRSHFVYMLGHDLWKIPHGYIVHHGDFDSRNDRFSNLELMTWADHDKLHRDYAKLYGVPPSFKGRKHRPDTIEKLREIAKSRGNNDIWDSPKSGHFDHTKAIMSLKASGKDNAMFRDDLDSVTITKFYSFCRSLAETAAHFNCSVSAVRYRLDPEIYKMKSNPLAGRERIYRFDDAEMVDFYKLNGGRLAAAKYGCSQATIYYRVKAFAKMMVCK